MALNLKHTRAILQPYGVDASPALCESIRTYIELFLKWNQRIALTTVTDPEEIVRFHFGESFFAAAAVPIRNGRLADVGSGAGFPGLALRLAVPDLDVTLIEANAKKAAFLSEVVRGLKLDSAHVVRGRIEEFPDRDARFDFVTARAVGQFEGLLAWSKEKLAPSGRIVLWLGESDCAEISKQAGWTWRDRIRVPDSERRFLLIGSRSE